MALNPNLELRTVDADPGLEVRDGDLVEVINETKFNIIVKLND